MTDENKQMDTDLADSIIMLEQILEVMPGDTMAVKALYNAYCQCDRRDRAFEYLGKLSDMVYDSGEVETAAFVVEQLQKFTDEFPSEAAAQLARIRTLEVNESPAPKEKNAQEEQHVDADISEELALAWKLYEENQLTQEEYSSILHDLTEISSKEVDVPVSVLHVLNDRGFNQMNRIMNYMSSRSGAPCISLLNFELPEKVSEVIPLDMVAHDGALPFGFFGNDLLVGVLNPYNNLLVDKVERVSGHRCHTYLVSPEEYDATLEKFRGMKK
jgi:hypothetical protein